MKIMRIKNKINKTLNNEDGVTLVLVICIFVFISILSLGIISVATNESLQSIDKNGLMQAEYVSVSGVEIMTDYIINHQDKFEGKYPDPGGNNFPLNLSLDSGSGNVDIDIETVDPSDDLSDLRIISTGNYGSNSSVKKAIIKKIDTTPDYIFPKGFTDTDELTGYEDLVIPTADKIEGDLDITSEDCVVNLEEDVTSYGDITVDSGRVLKFDTNYNEKTVIVDNITINGSFIISDKGKVFLIVNDSASFNSELLNANENLIILCNNTETINITIPNSKESYAYVFTKDGSVNLDGDGIFYGAIIAKNFTNGLKSSDNFNFKQPTKVLSLKKYIEYKDRHRYEFGYYEN